MLPPAIHVHVTLETMCRSQQSGSVVNGRSQSGCAHKMPFKLKRGKFLQPDSWGCSASFQAVFTVATLRKSHPMLGHFPITPTPLFKCRAEALQLPGYPGTLTGGRCRHLGESAHRLVKDPLSGGDFNRRARTSSVHQRRRPIGLVDGAAFLNAWASPTVAVSPAK